MPSSSTPEHSTPNKEDTMTEYNTLPFPVDKGIQPPHQKKDDEQASSIQHITNNKTNIINNGQGSERIDPSRSASGGQGQELRVSSVESGSGKVTQVKKESAPGSTLPLSPKSPNTTVKVSGNLLSSRLSPIIHRHDSASDKTSMEGSGSETPSNDASTAAGAPTLNQARSVMESLKQTPLTAGAPISTEDLSQYLRSVLGPKASSSLVSLTEPLPPMNPFTSQSRGGSASEATPTSASSSFSFPSTSRLQGSGQSPVTSPPVIVQGMSTAVLNSVMNSIANVSYVPFSTAPGPYYTNFPQHYHQTHYHHHPHVQGAQTPSLAKPSSLPTSPISFYQTPEEMADRETPPSPVSPQSDLSPTDSQTMLDDSSTTVTKVPTNTNMFNLEPITTPNTSTALLPHNSQPSKGTYIDVTEYLAMPQTEAARRLGIPTSTLSKRWKEASVHRKWPHRIVSKIDKEIMTLLHNIPRGEQSQLPPEIENSLGELLKRRQQELRTVIIRF